MATLSTLAAYDDLLRYQAVLTDGTAEYEFHKFAQFQEECRLQWLAAVDETKRLQRELENSCKTICDLETKLYHARRLLEVETKARREAEGDRETVEKRMIAVRELLLNERDIKEETRSKFAFLNSFPKKRKSHHDHVGNDINSTGSFLSDLSLTQSEDDFLDVRPTTAPWKKHRPSIPKDNSSVYVGKKARLSTDGGRRSTANRSHRVLDVGPNDKIVARTKVSVPQDDGPIEAESIIEAVPQQMEFEEPEQRPREAKTPRKSPRNKSPYTPAPSAPQIEDIVDDQNFPPNHGLKKSVLRQHGFTSKTFFKSEVCTQCQKKIRFGSLALKCRDCHVCIHTACRDALAIACVPAPMGSNGTPQRGGGQLVGFISDYTPSIGPMIPGLVVHCVTEIEARGLGEVGIYRVSGSEKDVKALKMRFLNSKTQSLNLSQVDVHVLCGCLKDFLRSLREPLIPTVLWQDFANAAQSSDSPERMNRGLYDAIRKLPQPNRDTLAFLIQHFQRVAQCPEIKMPLANIAKVFGPTIVGYSSADPDQEKLMTETYIQALVMEALLNVPTQYWSQFVDVGPSSSDDQQQQQPQQSNESTRYFMGTPSFRGTRKERKFYATPPYSNKKK